MRKKKKIILNAIAIAACGSMLLLSGCGFGTYKSNHTIVNVSYDPTREFYTEYNSMFKKHWKAETGENVDIVQSHGGSAKQALQVANGLEADVVTLALESDIDEIQDAGLIDKGWKNEFPNDSAPYTSTIVFLVRKGNPKHIKDWDDLVRDDVGVVTPNPETSGGARWNYIAAWGYAMDKFNNDEKKTIDFITKLYKNVVVLDSGARGATTSFVDNGQGDVLIAWENEAFLSLADTNGEFEMVTPSISILAQPSVAVVDDVTRIRGSKKVATEYLNYLYSDEAQRTAAENYFRPSNKKILKEYSGKFDLNMKLFTIDDFGGWDAVDKKHFSDNGIFANIFK